MLIGIVSKAKLITTKKNFGLKTKNKASNQILCKYITEKYDLCACYIIVFNCKF